mmetsp:Transcript_25856/g.31877  ORF Transcript_25856/g.31877 Transcript_25856/m.31877 type:complete len:171 (+) Transcript_25856:217-729(+)
MTIKPNNIDMHNRGNDDLYGRSVSLPCFPILPTLVPIQANELSFSPKYLNHEVVLTEKAPYNQWSHIVHHQCECDNEEEETYGWFVAIDVGSNENDDIPKKELHQVFPRLETVDGCASMKDSLPERQHLTGPTRNITDHVLDDEEMEWDMSAAIVDKIFQVENCFTFEMK